MKSVMLVRLAMFGSLVDRIIIYVSAILLSFAAVMLILAGLEHSLEHQDRVNQEQMTWDCTNASSSSNCDLVRAN